jgi:hypothetical protein
MSPIQQMLLGVGAVAKKSYIDDCFSTYLYRGTGTSNHSILNGIDLAGEGGLVWTKNRDGSFYGHNIFDTERGVGKQLKTNTSSGESTESNTLTTFLSNGFKLNGDNNVNKSGDDFVSWSFRKSPAFTICEWTGNGSNRTIAHSLGSVPGMIMIKCTSHGFNWMVYHRGANGGVNPANYGLRLNDTNAQSDNTTYFNDTLPTSTHFTIGTNAQVNSSGSTYVAYVFAGGESTAATARSVYFDGSDDYLKSAASSNYDFGSGDFTVEGWFKIANNTGWISYGGIVNVWQYGNSRKMWSIQLADEGGPLTFQLSADGSTSTTVASGGNIYKGQWYHFAAVRNGNNCKLFVNGTQVGSTGTFSGSIYSNTTDALNIGSIGNQSVLTPNAYISNIRVTKGQALYTSSFKVTTEPLTTTSQGAIASNVKLLCCNNSSVTGSTVTSGTITTNSSPTASTDSPFDDPAAHIFGESGSESVIKCGSYEGNGSSTGPEIFLGNGWEPQWVMVKRTDSAGSWLMLDTMRAWTAEGVVDAYMYANASDSESVHQWGAPTNTGMQMDGTDGTTNASGGSYIYLAIRSSDGYVGKPPELGTDVFAMDTGNGSNTIPAFDSGFPVDFGIKKAPASTGDWITSTRLTGLKVLRTNTTAAEGTSTTFVYDSNVGYAKSQDSTDQGWMWKRHAGFDVVCYEGNGVDRYISHSMNQSPEMMWFKKRNDSKNWYVYHSGLDGGSSPQNYSLRLNTTALEDEDGDTLWNQTAPTATHFRINTDNGVNTDGDDYIAMLFASVSGISKVGRYTGNGSNTGPIITTGFAPRFLIIRRAGPTEGDNWNVFDTVRGFSSSSDPLLKLNNSNAQLTGYDLVDPLSDGFQLVTTDSAHNSNNVNYIYYCHA